METLTQHFEAALAGSPVLAFLLVYVAGILTSLTPCVLPLFPVAVGTITATARRREIVDGKLVETVTNRGRAFMMGMAYAMGLASMFCMLGAAAALTGKAVFGLLASSPITYAVMAVLMLLLALWLAKGDRIDPNAWLQNWAFAPVEKAGILRGAVRWYAGTQGGGVATTFGFGFLSGILAGPCTAPVIAAVLAYIAKQQALGYGIALMFVYALGLATLMVLAGMSASLAMKLKSKGNLAKAVKLVFLAVMVVMAGYFSYQAALYGGLLPRNIVPAQASFYRILDIQQDGPEGLKAIELGVVLPDLSFEEVTLPVKADESGQDAAAKETVAPQRHKLSDYRGKVVYMPFWATWCKECVHEIPDVLEFVSQHASNERVVVLSVDVLEELGVVAPFAADKKLNYGILLDQEQSFSERLGINNFPYNLILGPDGRVAYSGKAFPKDHAALIEQLFKGGN